MDELLAEILASSLMSIGLFRPGIHRIAELSLDKQPAPFYERWLSSSIRYLQQRQLLGQDLMVSRKVRDLADLWLEWEEKKFVWAIKTDLQAQIVLLEACLKGLPGILSGKQLATDVIFPRSSMHLVEGIYRGHAVADYFNEVLGDTLSAWGEHKLQSDKEHKFRILEIGAGTGATTAKLLPLLQRFPVDEYCYTDVSRVFLMHADEQYHPRLAALVTKIFDVSKPLTSQAIAANRYDVVVATNVLHATPNIRETLRNVKAALKNQGIILLNEISTWSLFTHLTFGLLEGWWLHEDTALRLPGSPGLAPEKWQEVLAEEGFESIFFPAEEAHKFGQQIIVATSDGWVRQQLNKQAVTVPEHKAYASAITMPAPMMEKSAGPEDSLREKSIFYFQKLVASTLKMRSDQVEPRQPFAEYGLDSILVGHLTYQLRRAFSDVSATLFFEVHSIDGLVDYFLENKKQELVTVLSTAQPLSMVPVLQQATSTRDMRRQRRGAQPLAGVIAQEQETSAQASLQPTFPAAPRSAVLPSSIFDVAIIGLSGRYPRSNNLKEFWANLSKGVNCITEIPKDRWDWEKYYDAERGKPGKIYTKWGGFIEGIDQFDPLFFKISPKEAKRMDPQERVFLESCYHAIEDAGYTPENLGKPEKVGVFVGVMNSRYTPQPAHSSIANRVSYLFNFQGPSMAVDTACSSSLTAIHVALESIYSGLSTCAIAGGVNLIIDPGHYLLLTEMTMLSSSNQCKSFGQQADGLVDAEGVGAVVLKPLQQAQQDGDHIYAVIKGSAINAGGRTNGYTVPNPQAQARLVSQALERANLTAEHLSYVEAHGTGTALGDPIEIAGLTRAFKETSDKKQFCAIGSLKSNIGHCESAAGIAGLTKVLLQLKYEQLVPSLHSDVPNPEIDFSQTPFKIQKTLEKWQRPSREADGLTREMPRIAGVSSFGAGGSNAHVVVQEYQEPVRQSMPFTQVAILLSARTAEQLKQKARDLLEFIREEGQSARSADNPVDLATMAYTLQVGRELMEERLGLMVSSLEQLEEKLAAYVKGDQGIEDAYQGQVKRDREALSLFNTDADLQQTVDKWIAARKLSKLLELWVKGLDLDWSKLYGEAKPQRISLPTYPFAKERYWIDTGAASEWAVTQGATTAITTVVLHPLLHSNTSDLSEQRYSSIFTGEEFFLADHQVAVNGHGNQKVLPSVAYLEMARAAIEQAWPARPESAVLELHNTVWAQPVVVSESKSAENKVTQSKQVNIALLTNDRNNGEIDYEIYSLDAEQEIVHCQGRAVLSDQPVPARLDLEQLKGQMGQGKLEPGSVYAACARMGLVYGPAFQAISAIHRGNGQVLAQLRLPGPVADQTRDYVLHPSLMDGALQVAVGLIDGGPEPRQTRLPFALETLRIVSPCTREMFAWVRYAAGSQTTDNVLKLDIDLCDERGNVAAQMRGISWQQATLDMAEPVMGQAAAPAVAVAKATALVPAVRKEIIFKACEHAKPTLVEKKKPAAISLVAPSTVIAAKMSPESSMRPSSAKTPIVLLSAAFGMPRSNSAPGVSSVRLYDDGNGICSIQIAAPVNGVPAKDLIADVVLALDRAQQEASVKVLMLRGIEHCFRRGREDYNEAVAQGFYQQLVSFPCPVIAVMPGDETRGGLLAAALCDFMVCNEDATYGYTDTLRHFYPTTAEAALFSERFGAVQAADLLYVSTALTGQQLRRRGWTCPIVPGMQVEACAEQLASSLVTKSQNALQLLKQHLARGLVGLVKELMRVEPVTPATEGLSDRVAKEIVAPTEHIHLDTCRENVVVIRLGIANKKVGARELVAELGAILAQARQSACYKAIVLVSDHPGFLPETEPAGAEDVALDFQRLLVESEIPVVAALERDAKGHAWLISQWCDVCVYCETGMYSFVDVGPSQALTQRAAALFAHRLGNGAGKEILLTGAKYSGVELQQRVGSLLVVKQDQVLPTALRVAESLTKLPTTILAAWKKQTTTIVEKKIGKLPVAIASGREETNEIPEPLATVPIAIRLKSKVVTATAHPEGIVVVKMEDREARNMFSDAFMEGVREAFAHIEQTPTYKVVVLTGYDSYFSSGGTKEGLLAVQAGKAKFTDNKIFQVALECRLPVIAAMQGHGIGAGWSLGMLADVVLLSEESRYVSPYMNYGFTPGAGATYIFADKVGHDLARESLLTGQQYSGRELKDRGLRIAVFPRAEVNGAAMAMARQIARGSRDGLMGLKQQLIGNVRQVLEDTYRLELAMHEKTFVGQSDTLAQIQRNFYQEMEVSTVPAQPAHVKQIEASTTSAQQSDAETVRSSVDSDVLAAVTAALKTLLANELQMRESDIDENAQFIDLGLDSISGVTWVRKINEKFHTSIEVTKVYSNPTLKQLSRYVREEAEKHGTLSSPGVPTAVEMPIATDKTNTSSQSKIAAKAATKLAMEKLTSRRSRTTSRFTSSVSASVPHSSRSIAVIGMAGQFPQAKNPEEFWQNIAQGRNCITQVPSDRWDVNTYYQPGEPAAGKTNSQWVGALEGYDRFDPLFFNISPTEAESMDPQQRLFLQACWHSIENAGYDARVLSGSKCGVFVGCAAGDYHLLSREQQLSAQGFTGDATSILAARISYFLNLQGPCISIDTACSSSLVALAYACDSLASGGSDMALAGGVYVMAGPELHIKTSQAGMLSPAGKCYTFDQRADGFVPGEGVGVVVLKRLADAERDQDIIHGVIQGWGVNQDGKTNGITAPNPESQTRLEQEVYDKFRIDPASIQLVEAHGTGTKLGDPIEVEGLKKAFQKYTENKEYCALGSVKSNIGHCATAAGIAGVIKLVQALKHKQLPPTINFERLNEHIDLQDSPFYVNKQLQEWKLNGRERRQAAISSFGFSGTNAHVVMGEYVAVVAVQPPVTVVEQNAKVIVPLSARTTVQLKQKATDLREFLRQEAVSVDLIEMGYTLQVGREAMEERVGFLVRSVEQLEEKLEAYVAGDEGIEDTYQGQAKWSKESMGLISQDDEVKETLVNKWMAQKKLSKLVELWVNGLELDWDKLYGEAKPQRMDLPAYPFAKERYWIETVASEQDAASGSSSSGLMTAVLHPLLHGNTSDLSEQRYSSTFTGKEFFLADHQIRTDGRTAQKVLPGVAYLEMARAAIEQASPTQPESSTLELRDTVWLTPSVVTTEGKQLSIAVFENDNDQLGYEIYSVGPEQRIIHCQGQALFTRQPVADKLDIGQLKEQMGQKRLEASQIYAMFAKMGLNYGPAHQGINAIYVGEEQLIAQLHLPAVVERSRHEYVLHPSLMDSALQASIGLVADSNYAPSKPSVPFALGSLRIVSACTKEMFAWVRYAPGRQAANQVVKLDVDLCDERGNVCVQMRGFSSRVLESEMKSTRQETINELARDKSSLIEDDFSFDGAFYEKLIADILSRDVSVDEAVELG